MLSRSSLVLAAALASLLVPGCFFFSDFDYGCPGKLTIIATTVTQPLSGPWDLSRAWSAFNNTTAWSFGMDDFVLGNLSPEPEGATVWAGVSPKGSPTEDSNVTTWMLWGDSRCVAADAVPAEVERDEKRHGREWTEWRDGFLSATGQRAEASEVWALKFCCDERNEHVEITDWTGPAPTTRHG